MMMMMSLGQRRVWESNHWKKGGRGVRRKERGGGGVKERVLGVRGRGWKREIVAM